MIKLVSEFPYYILNENLLLENCYVYIDEQKWHVYPHTDISVCRTLDFTV